VRVAVERSGVACLVITITVAGVASSTAATTVGAGCPPKTARVGIAAATVDQVIAVARASVVGEVTHYQGRTVRRTRANTPVEAVIMNIGFSTAAGSRPLLKRAKRRCGLRVARYSSAVLFHDSLSVIANVTITKFVVRTDRGWWVYGA
jgi:hypothetical protein